MRKPYLLVLVLLSIIVIGAGVVLLVQQAPPQLNAALSTPLPGGEIPRISVQDLATQLDGSSPPLVWELRAAEDYSNGHIPGSRLVSFGEIEAGAAGIDRDRQIVTLCA